MLLISVQTCKALIRHTYKRISLYVRETKTVLDSGFHAIDSGFLLLDFRFFVSETRIPNSNL